ncbi:MAG: penicillin-binding protein activator [Porticoccaceae bacterium]
MPLLLRLRLSLVVVLLILGGCGSLPKPASPAYTKPATSETQAEQELAIALKSPSPEKEQHQLAAAKSYYQLKDYSRAEAVFRGINTQVLSLDALADFCLAYAALAMVQDEYASARALLTHPRLTAEWPQLPQPVQVNWRRARGDLFALLGDEGAGVAEYVALAHLLREPAEIADVHETIWRLLNRIGDRDLRQLSAETRDNELKGWYQLALASRSGGSDIRQGIRNFNAWRAQWPEHPAAQRPPASFNQLAQASADLPKQIALLLPLRGSHALAATTIRNGFLAAWYDQFSRDKSIPPLRLYDTSTAAIATVYQRAVADGAGIVIGPLREEEIKGLAAQPVLPVPVLGLNQLDASQHAPDNFFQFGLSVADEAVQVAERAWREGHRAALAITPATPWGKNALEAFRSDWQRRGGTLVVAPPYAMEQKDFTSLLRPVLLPGLSAPDVARMARAAAKNTGPAPQRRQDIDMVLLIAYPEQGRQIKPSLDFLFARDLPVYATSFIYAGGVNNQDRNQDLDSIRFTAMPSVLPGQGADKLKPEAGLQPIYRPLFALGVDAFQLHQWLSVMRNSPQTSIHGYTGTLTMAPSGRILREQPWAQFRDGRVIPVGQLADIPQ